MNELNVRLKKATDVFLSHSPRVRVFRELSSEYTLTFDRPHGKEWGFYIKHMGLCLPLETIDLSMRVAAAHKIYEMYEEYKEKSIQLHARVEMAIDALERFGQ